MHNKNIKSKTIGFTIVEVLVVLTVIGILASITIIGYSNWRSSTILTKIKSDLSGVRTAMEDARNFGNGYPATVPTSFKPSDGVTIAGGGDVTGKNYCVSAQVGSTIYFITDQTKDILQGPCRELNLTIIAGNGGTASASGTGNSRTITATANSNSAFIFGSWTGDSGCAGAASHIILMDSDKTCTANFIIGPGWIPGIVGTILEGKHVRDSDSGLMYFKTSSIAEVSPQSEVGLDPTYPSNMALVNPQTNPSVDFSAYPAQSACKNIGGRLPTLQEQNAIYQGRVTYGNNFQASWYWSTVEYSYNSGYLTNLTAGTVSHALKAYNYYVRCIVDF